MIFNVLVAVPAAWRSVSRSSGPQGPVSRENSKETQAPAQNIPSASGAHKLASAHSALNPAWPCVAPAPTHFILVIQHHDLGLRRHIAYRPALQSLVNPLAQTAQEQYCTSYAPLLVARKTVMLTMP